MSIYDILAAQIPFRMCSSGQHRWPIASVEQAEKCCNGFERVAVPIQYRSQLDAWLSSTEEVDAHTIHWVYILLPDKDSDTIKKLQEKFEAVSWVFRMNRQD